MTGRPRDPEMDKRLLAAAWELLQSDGYDALSMTKVAAAADAHRSDVYRRWSSKAMLVVDVLDAHLPPTREFDHGDLRKDLRAYVGDLAKTWSSDWVDGAMGLTGDLHTDPDAELAWQELAVRRGSSMHRALLRAAERGEIANSDGIALVGDFIEGALMHRRMIARQPLPKDYLDTVATTAFHILTTTVTA